MKMTLYALGFAVAILFFACAPAQESAPEPSAPVDWRAAIASAFAGDGGAPEASAPVDWRTKAAELLQPDAIAQLERDGILVVDQSWRQMFSPYLSGILPIFVTSDSVLNAFHVLYAESILQLERANKRRLPDILRTAWRNLPAAESAAKGDPEVIADARRRARVIIGTALRLLGEATPDADPAIAALIAAEVDRITAAREQTKPAWLGPPDNGFLAIDYNRFTPRGFYCHSEAMTRYFRAVTWLQAIPFRVSIDAELLTVLFIGHTVSPVCVRNRKQRKRIENQLTVFTRLLGARDDWDLTDAVRYAKDRKWLDMRRFSELRQIFQALDEDGEGPVINDQIGFLSGSGERSFRIFSSHRTLDAILLQRTTDLREFDPRFPTGLEVAAALRSTFARSNIEYKDREKLLAVIDRSRDLFDGDSLYAQYMQCLAALFDEPEPSAPAFMAGDPWAAKSCQTALAGWAQMRHTWALQAKQSLTSYGDGSIAPGFVEPTPEFFARMGRFIRNTTETLRNDGAYEGDSISIADVLREIADEVERRTRHVSSNEPVDFHLQVLSVPGMLALQLQSIPEIMATDSEYDSNDVRGYSARVVPLLRQLAKDHEAGKQPIPAAVQERIVRDKVHLEPLWQRLGNLCRHLESIARKQLDGTPLSDADRELLLGYGKEIAGIMLYGGNSYSSPRDDAPRIIDAFRDATLGKSMLIGISRPRTLYVLYPTANGKVLCRGAVMPYYEFTSVQRLADSEWKDLLDSADRPPIPAWSAPIVSGGTLTSPARRNDMPQSDSEP